ncbi:MAG: hypothetical protein P4L51_17955 [Puia sp.]|nr:hypothetical protein [Puia sp.]
MKLAIIGDFREHNPTHIATDDAIRRSLGKLGTSMEVDWVDTATLPDRLKDVTGGYQGFLIAPGSPYASMEGVLSVIRYARVNGVPALGTCGGFQHMIIEFARHVLGIPDAGHAETDPYASRLVITPLSCSLVGQRLEVRLFPGSRAYQLAGPVLNENYYCNFGLNPDYRDAIDRGGFRVAADDSNGEVRVLELEGHPWFVGTLFVPQASSTAAAPHPLVTGFLQAVAVQAGVSFAE